MSRALTIVPPKNRCTVHWDLSRGMNAATARLEWRDRPLGGLEARLTLEGWLDRGALVCLAGTLDELRERGLVRLSVDCAYVRHVEFAAVPHLLALLRRLTPVTFEVTALSPHLRDLFRIAGCKELAPVGPLQRARTLVPDLEREWAS